MHRGKGGMWQAAISENREKQFASEHTQLNTAAHFARSDGTVHFAMGIAVIGSYS